MPTIERPKADLLDVSKVECVGDRRVFHLPASLPITPDGLRPMRRYVVTLEDVDYVNSEGDVVTSLHTCGRSCWGKRMKSD